MLCWWFLGQGVTVRLHDLVDIVEKKLLHTLTWASTHARARAHTHTHTHTHTHILGSQSRFFERRKKGWGRGKMGVARTCAAVKVALNKQI